MIIKFLPILLIISYLLDLVIVVYFNRPGVLSHDGFGGIAVLYVWVLVHGFIMALLLMFSACTIILDPRGSNLIEWTIVIILFVFFQLVPLVLTLVAVDLLDGNLFILLILCYLFCFGIAARIVKFINVKFNIKDK